MSAAEPAPRAAVVAPAGLELSQEERDLYVRLPPAGFILFARNCATPAQVTALVASLREAGGRVDAPVLIDQEGGRVARLRPPSWPDFPALSRIGDLAAARPREAEEAAFLHARLIAHGLAAHGIDVDCAPCLDVRDPDGHDVIGDRSYSGDAATVTALGRAAIDGFLAGGVLPVLKHLPGHGRGRVDSHASLPEVDAGLADLEARDFVPFRALAGAPMAMTAHIRYKALDPERPATLSGTIVRDVIRGSIGFRGTLFTDDISMGALAGDLSTRTRQALAAGCDIALHCNGDLGESEAVLCAAGPLAGASRERFEASLARRTAPALFDADRARARLADLLTPVV
ncbi:beta-N-acetylhexosaminidase [Marinivivus vitaminiproducens]|uniref:beta-N-acetylhexosaminidase n=1 Tax=Marinivivus vitaminiproducens TaxID=3035935 RepID=UPI00279A51D1|nr:beta-N-acetylhexosaminidase [Geminicoccaceae bacterium SCSIO 64248]